jgi:hypothetical protein
LLSSLTFQKRLVVTVTYTLVVSDFEEPDVTEKRDLQFRDPEFIKITKLDSTTNDLLRWAVFSIVSNAAEGPVRFSKPDRRISLSWQGTPFLKCIAIPDVLEEAVVEGNACRELHCQAEMKASKIDSIVTIGKRMLHTTDPAK